MVRAHDARVARDAQAQLAAAGVEASALAGLYRPAPDGEDILILPAADLSAAQQLAGAALSHERRPIATLAGLPASAPFASGAAGVGPFSGAVALDAPPRLLHVQVQAWARIAIIEDEQRRRHATAQDRGVAAPAKLEARQLKVLYIGAPNATFLALEHALAGHNGAVAAAFSSYSGFDHLHDEPFDAVVLNGALDSTTALSLCSALRRNSSLYHLPTMMVTVPGDAQTAAAAVERGACTVAAANQPFEQSLGWLFEAVRRERRRRTAEHDLRALRDVMGEARTGLFTSAAFDAHLCRLARDHHASGRPLALSVLRVLPAHGANLPSDAVWKRGFDEIASLAARLMRECDSGAAIGKDFIAVAMPATNLAGAKRTAMRIAAVAECTAFASGDNGAGPLVFEQSAVELQLGESGAGMLARALRALDTESLTA